MSAAASRRRGFCYLEVAGLLTMGMGLEPMSISVRNEPGRRGVRTGSIEDWELVMSRAADAEAVGSPELLRPEPSTREYLFGDFAGERCCPAWCATKAIRLNLQSRLSLSPGTCRYDWRSRPLSSGRVESMHNFHVVPFSFYNAIVGGTWYTRG